MYNIHWYSHYDYINLVVIIFVASTIHQKSAYWRQSWSLTLTELIEVEMEGHSILNLLNHFVILSYCYSACHLILSLSFCLYLQYCDFAILPFCLYLPYCDFAILSFCHSAILHAIRPFFHPALLQFWFFYDSAILLFWHLLLFLVFLSFKVCTVYLQCIKYRTGVINRNGVYTGNKLNS